MKVYLTNDDGITAPGLRVLAGVVSDFSDDVTVVAPKTNQSGKSQAITIDHSLHVKPYATEDMGIDAYAVAGTPTDCVRLIMAGAFGEPPDLLLSGVNWGSNLGPDVYLSGTVGAARQAALHRIPAIAWSTDNFSEKMVADLVAQYLESTVAMALASPGTLYNVNFPMRGGTSSALATLNGPWYTDQVTWVDGSHADLSREIQEADIDVGSDVFCVRQGLTSISPIVVSRRAKKTGAVQNDLTVKIG